MVISVIRNCEKFNIAWSGMKRKKYKDKDTLSLFLFYYYEAGWYTIILGRGS